MLVQIARFDSGSEAEVARSALAASGIEAVLFDGAMNGYVLGGLVSVRLMVLDEDAAIARRTLADVVR